LVDRFEALIEALHKALLRAGFCGQDQLVIALHPGEVDVPRGRVKPEETRKAQSRPKGKPEPGPAPVLVGKEGENEEESKAHKALHQAREGLEAYQVRRALQEGEEGKEA
jgi:hypothetical protein